MYGGGAPTVRFAPVAPWAKTGPASLITEKKSIPRDGLGFLLILKRLLLSKSHKYIGILYFK
jgi:hypothetical protein